MPIIDKQKNSDYDIAEYSRDFEDQRLVHSFADFLSLSEISGRQHSPDRSSLLSAESVFDQETTVEVIKDDNLKMEQDTTPLTILAHRDEHKELRSIEVICSCGKRATIALDYDEDYGPPLQ